MGRVAEWALVVVRSLPRLLRLRGASTSHNVHLSVRRPAAARTSTAALVERPAARSFVDGQPLSDRRPGRGGAGKRSIIPVDLTGEAPAPKRAAVNLMDSSPVRVAASTTWTRLALMTIERACVRRGEESARMIDSVAMDIL